MEVICLSQRILDLLDYGSIVRASSVSKKWLSVYGSDETRKRSIRLYGIDKRRRMAFWAHFSGARKVPYGIYEPCFKLRVGGSFDEEEEDDNDQKQGSGRTGLEGEISRDVTRTFPTHSCFALETGLGQTMLFNILNALAVRYPQVGYCQGMNFVVAVMILVAAESSNPKHNSGVTDDDTSYENTNLDYINENERKKLECTVFSLMCAFLDNFDMQELWRPCVPQLKLRIYQFGRILHRKLPVLEARFAEIGVTPDFFASQWFLTLLSYNLPLDLLVRVWDVLVLDGWKTVFRVGISLLKAFEKPLLLMGLEELSHFFRHNKLTVSQNDLLEESFFNCKISTRSLSELESDYVGYVLRNQLGRNEKESSKAALLLEPTHVIDKRLVASIQAEIENMEVPLKNDITILRNKIEQAEKARADAFQEFKETAEEYEAVKCDLEELQEAKAAISSQLEELEDMEVTEEEYESLQEKISWIESQIEIVDDTYRDVVWRTSQAQVILEETLERKNAFSQQLFAVMHENEQKKVAHMNTFKSLIL